MSETEPNWSLFYRRLQRLGPRMLKGVPKDYRQWVEETSVDTDTFWPGTQERFYTYWGWSKSAQDQREAVIQTLKLWASNVKRELEYMLDIFEESPQKIRALRNRVQKIELTIDDRSIDLMLAGARSPIKPQGEEDMYSDDDDILK